MSKGQGTLAQRKRTAGRRGEKAGSLDPRVSKGGGRNDWALSSRETMRKRRVRTKWGRLAEWEIIAQRSTDPVLTVDGGPA